MKMNNVKAFSIISIILFISGCAVKEEIVNEKIEQQVQDNGIIPSNIPPAESEILYLKNGYQITSRLAALIDEKCRQNNLSGGDTGNGYGCI